MKIKSKNNKKGISLIVLVITIIVMIILAATVILSLSSNGIINRANEAVSDTDIKQVQSLANTLWAEAYLVKREDSSVDIDTYVRTKLDENNMNVDKYIVEITDKGVEVEAKAPRLEKWKDSVWDITNDGVPIPKGFVASPYSGEQTKAGGLVIYQLTEEEIERSITKLPKDEAHETALTTRNQYVWVPIAKEEFKTRFIRSLVGLKEYEGDKTNINWDYISNTLGEESYELILDLETNIPLYEENLEFYGENFTKDSIEMYESVKEYEGFYVGRYEAGINFDTGMIECVMGKMPISGPIIGDIASPKGAEDVELYGCKLNTIYGVHWDAIMQWFLDSGIGDNIDIIQNHGNFYYEHGLFAGLSEIVKELNESDFNSSALIATSYDEEGFLEGSPIEFDENGKIKNEVKLFDCLLLSTGALKKSKINNIYDMLGNFDEMTTEQYMDEGSTLRGGCYSSNLALIGTALSGIPITILSTRASSSTVLQGGGGEEAMLNLSTRFVMYIK